MKMRRTLGEGIEPMDDAWAGGHVRDNDNASKISRSKFAVTAMISGALQAKPEGLCCSVFSVARDQAQPMAAERLIKLIRSWPDGVDGRIERSLDLTIVPG